MNAFVYVQRVFVWQVSICAEGLTEITMATDVTAARIRSKFDPVIEYAAQIGSTLLRRRETDLRPIDQ